MTETLKSERPSSTDDQPSGSLWAAASDRSRIAAAISGSFARFCSLLGRTIVSVALAAAFLEIASWAVWSIHPMTRQAELENQIGSPVYAGVDWAREFWQEESSRRKKTTVYVPFRIWGVTSWHGKYINNDEVAGSYLRRTINASSCDPPNRLSVWTFGGSTMYGTAVPDWATIPSYLSRELNGASRQCFVIANFGVEGYVTDQELILLQEQLKAGGRPDIVIFYDGVNDSSLAWPPPSPPNAHFLFRVVKSRVEGSLAGRLDFLQKSYAARMVMEVLAHLHRATSFASQVSRARPNVVATLNNYEANMQLAHVLGDAYKFKVYCFWQPMLTYGHKPFVPFEQQLATRDVAGDSADSAWFLTMAQVFQEEEHRAAGGGRVVFLGGLFDTTQEPIYVDEAHLGPRGNELVARAIAGYIQNHSE